ncbi:adenosylmethionine--8-amino-7-oxononanoate transaminase [Chitinophaga rhizophila]|uniref:Adenosylmethionine-8-amino-7-oxononanoate aminotransferase n=1 Tax=Chitinophaga rhizophila TaxID=2866212 RepID=A0ABS7G7H8_9BACT|nr:adenosylmethionine--8-amino-7-oxononanoate transaminase [Chitinophaga rhizophila]MBW8683613.1 adenosylmethionine--8-amino-7-oxononanoate transaminase [Chitinophaga rhizophila]
MLWYPYTQMKQLEELPKMIAGEGVMMHLEDGRSLIDGISSWWAVIHGYNHPVLNAALITQVNKFAHVMLGGMTHGPALDLAAKLVQITPPGLAHVFFSDSGSIGVEVALKMSIQYWKNLGYQGKNKIISLRNGYHGDTFKAMEVSDDSDFTRAFADVLSRGFVLDIPAGGFDADTATVQAAADELEQLLHAEHRHIAAFIVEPVVQCAGGFNIYSPRYLQIARELCTKYNVLFVFDEVATGFGRTGKMFAAEHAGVTPDIMIIGKALTAGYMGHAATLATTSVFNSFLGENYEKALMHGPTFMANPLACTVALQSISLIESSDYLQRIAHIQSIIREALDNISSPAIVQKRTIGAIGAIELRDAACLNGFKAFSQQRGVWLRPIGNVLYLMPPYVISEQDLLTIINVMKEWIGQIK